MDLLELLTDYDANGSFADMAKNINTTDGDGYAWYVRITDLENPKPLSELKYVDESSYEFLKKTELHGGELLMAKRGNIGKVYIFEPRTKYATVAPNMYLLKLNNKVIPHFLYDYFVSEEGNKKLTRLNASSTMGALYKDDVKNIDVIMPSIEEQAMIGNFFQSIDHIITLHQRKYNKLLNVKKSMLEKMFPKNGSNIPEIRFKGFTDPWEQRKLLSCIEKITDFRGRTPKKLGMDWSESGYLALSALNVKDGYIDFSQDVHYGEQALYDKWMSGNELHKGQVLFTTEAPMGNVAQVPDNKRYILSQRTIAFDVKEDIITENFLATLLRSPAVFNTLTSLSSGGTAKGVSQKSLAGVDIQIPVELREQELLATYFANLDNLITLHQRELEKLQNIKKSMLEKMFV